MAGPGPSQAKSKGKTRFLAAQSWLGSIQTASFPNLGLAWMASGGGRPSPGLCIKRHGEMHLLFSEGIKMKQQEEFPSCHDHTLLKQAAEGGGGPSWRRSMSWLLRAAEEGSGGWGGMGRPLGSALKVRYSQTHRRALSHRKRHPLSPSWCPPFPGTLSAPALPSDFIKLHFPRAGQTSDRMSQRQLATTVAPGAGGHGGR